jgi:hypothetical protein
VESQASPKAPPPDRRRHQQAARVRYGRAPTTRWAITITGPAGRALAHGVARGNPVRARRNGDRGDGRGGGGWTIRVTAEPITTGPCDSAPPQPPPAAWPLSYRDPGHPAVLLPWVSSQVSGYDEAKSPPGTLTMVNSAMLQYIALTCWSAPIKDHSGAQTRLPSLTLTSPCPYGSPGGLLYL